MSEVNKDEGPSAATLDAPAAAPRELPPERRRDRSVPRDRLRIAVLLPCYNEEKTIGAVVADFRAVLPGAAVYVYDNNSTDGTVAAALAAGALVGIERQQGKGNVVRRMFSDIEADLYVMTDGDGTYDAASAPMMIATLLEENLDMVVGARLDHGSADAFRLGHQFGNRLLTGLVAVLFGGRFKDMLSGYRVFSRRFVKSFPALAQGFETETELTIHAQSLQLPVREVDTPYYARPQGSVSKLRTYRDGWRILMTALKLLKQERPLFFFSGIFVLLAGLSLILGIPVLVEYMLTHFVSRVPTAILATGVMILAFLSLACGVILDNVTHSRRELKRLVYLQQKAPAGGRRPGRSFTLR